MKLFGIICTTALVAIFIFAIFFFRHIGNKNEAEYQHLIELAVQHHEFPVVGTIIESRSLIIDGNNEGTIVILNNDTAIGLNMNIDFIKPNSKLKIAPKDKTKNNAYCVVSERTLCAYEIAVITI